LAVIDGVILDTGPLVAYLIERDDFHGWAVEVFASLPPLFWTCEAVLMETAYLIDGAPAGMRLIESLLDQDYLRITF
jgi:predicted nucleic acid-binding protein